MSQVTILSGSGGGGNQGVLNNFTFQPLFNGSSTGIVFNPNEAAYAVVGNIVYYHVNVIFSNIGSFSGSDIFSIAINGSGLPSPETTLLWSGTNIYSTDMTGAPVFVVLDFSGSNPFFYLSASPKITVVNPSTLIFDTASAATYSNFTNTSAIAFTGCYNTGN